MTLKEKGEWNLKLAEILDSREFLDLPQFQKEHFQIRREHLCSVIINRLYYGVYLIAKGKLVDKGIYELKSRISHSGKDCIWDEIMNENCASEINLAHQLRNMRNKADYEEGDDTNEIARAKEITLELYNILKGIE